MDLIFYETDADLYNAILFHHHITVWQDGDNIGTGIIKSFTADSVLIGNDHYFRSSCMFTSDSYTCSG